MRIFSFFVFLLTAFNCIAEDSKIKNIPVSKEEFLKTVARQNEVNNPTQLLIDLRTDLFAFKEEYGYFTTDLVELGFMPKGAYTYACGFRTPSAARPKGSQVDSNRSTSNSQSYLLGVTKKFPYYKPKFVGTATSNDFPASGINGSSFVVACISRNGNKLDMWTIDEKKEIRHLP